jgi:hypothetical protein
MKTDFLTLRASGAIFKSSIDLTPLDQELTISGVRSAEISQKWRLYV